MFHDEKPLAASVPTTVQLIDVCSAQYGERPLPDLDDHASHLAKLESSQLEPTPSSRGTAGVGRAVFLLIKAFVGTGILFLPKAFYNGGMVFSIVVMLFVAALSLWSYLLLVRAREHCTGPASFGDIAEQTMGTKMRFLVQTSIAISQLGFVCAYMIFIAENIHHFISNVTRCTVDLSIGVCILMQLAVFIPFALIRRIEKLGFATIIAEVCILFGLGYIYYYDIKVIVEKGVAPSVAAFNPNDFAMFIGTAVYSFEGIGLVIPITESMRNPEKFPRVLWITLVIVAVLFTSVGSLSYAAFGSDIKTMVTMNLPQGSAIVHAIQIIYAFAIVLSVPLQLFPAITILEKGCFGYNRSGRNSLVWKWSKNAFRVGLLGVCVAVSWAGANDLDKFVSLIGSFACIPLCFIYPPLFHWKSGACHGSNWRKWCDWLLTVFGIAVMIYASYRTVVQWAAGGGNDAEQCVPSLL